MREFPFAKNLNVSVVLRNELGNSLPFKLGRRSCHQIFTSLIRETGDKVPDILQSSWTGYAFITTI
jgi:hypothetical protein